MIDEKLFSDTEKLIRCSVTNRYKELSVRFVEVNNYRLWEHLMTNRHDAVINDVKLCLWVNNKAFQSNENIYSQAEDVEAVNRIVVDLYDEEYSFSNTIIRYVRASETEQVISILRSHISKDCYEPDDCDIQTHEGFNIVQKQHDNKRPMIIGLDY